MRRFEFYEQLERGKKGERAIISLLKQNYKDCQIIDVSEDDEYKENDIDVIKIDNLTGKKETIEIKCDETNYKTWNIFAEFCSCKRINSPGWLLKSKADIICYSFTKKGCLFMIPRQVLLNLIKEHNFRIGEAYDKYKVSQGYLIPVNMIQQYMEAKEEYKEIFKSVYSY